jgi:hypothetical protein
MGNLPFDISMEEINEFLTERVSTPDQTLGDSPLRSDAWVMVLWVSGGDEHR